MANKLDSENLGIITQNSFFEEFYGGETIPEVPKSFKLYHYNGLARSCADNKVSNIILILKDFYHELNKHATWWFLRYPNFYIKNFLCPCHSESLS